MSRGEFSNPQFPHGQSWNGIVSADFPSFTLDLPGAGTIPVLSALLSRSHKRFLSFIVSPDYGQNRPSVFPMLFWGLASASFVGNGNTWTLTYGFIPDPPTLIPEPPTLLLLGIALAGLGFSRRHKLQ